MLYNTLRWLNFRVRSTRSRAAPTRPSARPTLELLERREVPTITSITTPSIVATSSHSPPNDNSFILGSAIGYNSYGNTDTAYITEQTQSGQPQPLTVQLSFTIMSSTGTVGAATTLVTTQYDSYGRVISQLNTIGSAGGDGDGPNAVDCAAGANGPFAIAYIVNSDHYPNSTATQPDYTRETLYVAQFHADGTLIGTTAVTYIENDNPSDTTHRYWLADPKIGVDTYGSYTVVWTYTTQVDPIGGAHAAEQIQLWESRQGGSTNLVAQSNLDAGINGFGDPADWNGERVKVPDVDTNASGQSVIVFGRFVTIKNVASEYMDLENVFGQLVDATGALTGSVFAVSQHANTYEPNAYPAVAMNNSNAFIVSWNYIPPYTIPNSQLPATRGVYARLWEANGTSPGEFLVVASPHVETEQHYPYRRANYYVAITQHPVGMDGNGNFVVGYADETSDPTSLPTTRVRLQAYHADGSLNGSTVDIGDNGSPFAFGVFQVAMAPDGTFAVAGRGNPPPVDDEIFAQLFKLT